MGANHSGIDDQVLKVRIIPAAALDEAKAAIVADPSAIDAVLDRLFASDRLEDVYAALAADGGDWAAATLATLATKSPQTMKVSLRLLAEGANMSSFVDEMRQEYAIACRVMQRPDFIEGVRAVIVDKDNQPRWVPATPSEVSDTLIDQIFAPLPDSEAWTPAGGSP